MDKRYVLTQVTLINIKSHQLFQKITLLLIDPL